MSFLPIIIVLSHYHTMSTLLTDLREESKLIDKLAENGYAFTNLPTLLNSIGIHKSHEDIKRILTTTNDIKFIDATCNMGIENAVSVCDELCETRAVDLIIDNEPRLRNVATIQIINASLINNYNELITACNNGYRIIGPATCPYNSGQPLLIQQINNACANGLCMQEITISASCLSYGFASNIYSEVTRIKMYDVNFTTHVVNMLESFENIDTLSMVINLDNFKEIYAAYDYKCTFTKKVKTLTTNWMAYAWLDSFQNLRSLDVSNNAYITTCDAFAESLRVVIADGNGCAL